VNIPFFRPWITQNDKTAVLKSLSQQWLTNGPQLSKFENLFKKTIGSKFTLGVTTGTASLHLAVSCLNLKPGDEVIVPTLTFTATADVVKHCGGIPVFCDVDPDSFNIDTKFIEKLVSQKTKAIMVVHYGGQSCDMDKIKKIANKYNLKIIEDCAHALGSKFQNTFCGNIGEFGCFSFYPTKIITTGEGGMITTKNKKYYEKIKLLRSHGINRSASERATQKTWKYDVIDLGFNFRLDEIRASLGLSQLQRIVKINKMRISVAEKYTKKLSKIKGIVTPKLLPNRNHIFHLYTIKINSDFHLTRNGLFEYLTSKNIGSSVQYIPLHKLSSNKKFKKNKLPNAEKIQNEILSLPIFPTITDREINAVVSAIKNS
jgi:perosamine synthetase